MENNRLQHVTVALNVALRGKKGEKQRLPLFCCLHYFAPVCLWMPTTMSLYVVYLGPQARFIIQR